MPELDVETLIASTMPGRAAETIRAEEENYRRQLREVANAVLKKNAKVVLLAGPSGSGKTTTANLLSDLLSMRGHPSSVVSLDNFYRAGDDPDYPLNKAGEQDYECVDSLRIPLIRECIGHILRGESFRIPRFDFETHIPEPDAIPVDVCDGGVVVIEGLHALNPRLTEGLPEELIFGLFVSVSTNLNLDGERILSGRKCRFVRRLTRDYLYRASDAHRTLSLWDDVLRGEDLYLYPFRPRADYCMNTFHLFELGIMRPFALKVLDEGMPLHSEYAEHIRSVLKMIPPIELSLLPQTSLICEFVPGGIYEDLY